MCDARRTATIVTVLLLGLAGCSETPSAPDFQADGQLTEDAELEIAADETLSEVLVEDAETGMEDPSDPEVADLLAGARERFRAARLARRDGNAAEARRLAKEARTRLARALIADRGEEALAELRERLEVFLAGLDGELEDLEEPRGLRERLAALSGRAGRFADRGQREAAAERFLFALQRADLSRARRHDRETDRFAFARLQVARAGEAVDLARRLLEEAATGPTETQRQLLAKAERLAEVASAALQRDALRRAAVYARHAEWVALVAVVDLDGVTREEAREIRKVARALLERAREAVGGGDTPSRQRLLRLAVRLFEAGTDRLEDGEKRGVALLWRSATTSSVLLP